MSTDWETWLRNASGPASDDEETKRDRTEERIRTAIQASNLPASVRVRAKGSYANNTNVRLDSDVDIDVECTDTFTVNRAFAAKGASVEQLGYTPVERVSMAEFRREVLEALVSAFGSAAVDPGDKAIAVAAGSTTLDADVVPCQTLRRYDSPTPSGYNEGTLLLPRSGGEIYNWPQQNYDNGVRKNKATGTRYKSMVRCLKRLENVLLKNSAIAAPVPGYLTECLAWNVPNDRFGHDNLIDDMRNVFAFLWGETKTAEGCEAWGEINELKYLFRPHQKWTREQAHVFVSKAWDTIGVD